MSDPNFCLEHVALGDRLCGLDLGRMPLTGTALDRPLEVEARGTSLRLEPYETALLAAELDVVMLRGLAPGASLLAAAPPADHDAVAKRFGARAPISTPQLPYLRNFRGTALAW